MNRFWLRPVIYSGADALDALAEFPSQRTLVVTDGFWVSSGGIEQVVRRLQGEVRLFDQVTGEPDTEMVAKGVALFREFRPEGMVALGGGSVLDCAKAVRKFALPEGETIPLWAAPTTAGTGSEVTSFAVIAREGVKVPLVEDALLPDGAILHSGFLSSLPAKAVADTGMDALSHALEAAVSTGAEPFSMALTLEAAGMIWRNLPGAVAREGDTPERQAMLTAACMAGVAFNSASLGICHGLSHAIGGRFHLPHGKINAILLPAVVRFNAGLERPGRELNPGGEGYVRVAQACGLTSSGGRTAVWALVRGLERMRIALNLPKTLAQAGLDRGEFSKAIPELVDAALADRCTATNPIPVTRGDAEGILSQVMG